MAKRLTDIQKTRKVKPVPASSFVVPEVPATKPAAPKAPRAKRVRGKIRWWRWLLVVILVGVFGFIVVALGGGVIGGVLQYRELTSVEEVSYSADELATQAKKAKDEGDLAAAEKSYEQAVAKEAKVDYQVQLALVKYRLKKYDEAITGFRALIRTSTEPAFLWNGIGNMYRDWAYSESAQRAERIIEAETAYRSAFGIDKKYQAAYSNLALMLEEDKQLDKAIRVVEQGVANTQSRELQQLLDRLKAAKLVQSGGN